MDTFDYRAAARRAAQAAGGNAPLGRQLVKPGTDQPVSGQAVGQWQKVPRWFVQQIFDITGIPPHDLRPDLFPPSIDCGNDQKMVTQPGDN